MQTITSLLSALRSLVLVVFCTGLAAQEIGPLMAVAGGGGGPGVWILPSAAALTTPNLGTGLVYVKDSEGEQVLLVGAHWMRAGNALALFLNGGLIAVGSDFFVEGAFSGDLLDATFAPAGTWHRTDY